MLIYKSDKPNKYKLILIQRLLFNGGLLLLAIADYFLALFGKKSQEFFFFLIPFMWVFSFIILASKLRINEIKIDKDKREIYFECTRIIGGHSFETLNFDRISVRIKKNRFDSFFGPYDISFLHPGIVRINISSQKDGFSSHAMKDLTLIVESMYYSANSDIVRGKLAV